MRKSIARVVLPDAGKGKRGPEGRIGYLLRQAAGAHRLRMERALADLDVTPPQFSVMTMLAAYPGLSNADLARLTLLTPQTVSLIVSNLERSAVIQKRAHAIHGRIQHLELTRAGRILLEKCSALVHDVENKLTDGLTDEEQGIVRRWLANVAVGDTE